MNKKWRVLAIGLGLAMVLTTVSVPASAGGPGHSGGRSMRSAGKVFRSGGGHRSARMPSLNSGRSSSIGRSIGRSSGHSSWGSLNSSRGSGSRSSKHGGGNLGNLGNILGGLGDLGVLGGGFPMGDYGYYGGPWGDRHHDEDDMAKAYREVGMTNAVVNLIGVIAETAVATSQNNCNNYNNRYNAAPSAGHWERQAVILEPARQEQYQVYVEPLYDQRTGQKISGGYNETRTRTVPEVVQYRDVWVPDNVPR